MLKRSPLKRTTPLRRKAFMRRVNTSRRKKLHARQLGPQAAACREMVCCVCGARPCVPHHVRSRGAGGLDCDCDCDCVPLCAQINGCHDVIHAMGQESFEAKCGIDLRRQAAGLHAKTKERASAEQ